MNIVQRQQHFEYDYNKNLLMKRLADASQFKIYPSILPRNELPLRKILLTTRLWNHVRRQQALVTTIPSDDWLYNQQQPIDNSLITSDIPTSSDTDDDTDWTWLNKSSKEKKRSRKTDEETEQNLYKKSKSTVDYPVSPAGPATTSTTANTTTAVLLSA